VLDWFSLRFPGVFTQMGGIYVGSGDDVYALNAATGAKEWTGATGGPVSSSPAVANGVVYVGSQDDVYALNAATGAKEWSYTTGGPVESSPAVANGLVYVGSNDHHVYALNTATGAEEWSYTGSSGADLASPMVANGMVYINISNNSDLYAFSLPRGTAAVRRPLPRQLHPNYRLRPQNGKRS